MRARTARWDCRQDPQAGSASRQPPLIGFVAEMNAVLSEQLDPVGDGGDFNDESVLSPSFRFHDVRHCLPAAARTAQCAEDKPQLAAIKHCKVGVGCITW